MNASTSEIIYTITASVSTGALMLGAGYRLFDVLLEKKLLEMEAGIFNRINGSYVRRAECALLHEQSNRNYDNLYEIVKELKRGMDIIQRKMLDREMD